MRFLVDAQLPPALARWLAAAGHEAEHVSDCGLARGGDAEVWQRAVETKAAIVSKDEDFATRRLLTESGPVILWVRLGNARREVLLTWFEAQMPAILVALERGDTLIELA